MGYTISLHFSKVSHPSLSKGMSFTTNDLHEEAELIPLKWNFHYRSYQAILACLTQAKKGVILLHQVQFLESPVTHRFLRNTTIPPRIHLAHALTCSTNCCHHSSQLFRLWELGWVLNSSPFKRLQCLSGVEGIAVYLNHVRTGPHILLWSKFVGRI